MYIDDCNGLSEDEIEQNYGVYGNPIQRFSGQTGAGHPPDENDLDLPIVENAQIDSEWVDADDIDDFTAEEMIQSDANSTPLPLPAPDQQNPFSDSELQVFENGLIYYKTHCIIPPGYGMTEAEWENGEYPILQCSYRPWDRI